VGKLAECNGLQISALTLQGREATSIHYGGLAALSAARINTVVAEEPLAALVNMSN
jgi:hypothetical protein